MSRSLWWPVKCAEGEVIEYEGRRYVVRSQSMTRMKSAHFGYRYYTLVERVEK